MGDGFVGGAGGALATAIMFLLFISSFITIYPFHRKDMSNETESSDSSSKPNCVGQDWCEGNDSLAYGEFGLENTNPIRVSGPHGMGYYVSYLSEVFSKSFSYHRLGSRSSENENIPKMIDIYEIFDENGFKYPTLYVCMYSYAPSSKIPDCFTFKDSRVGELKDRDYYGRGTYTYPNGDKYVGEWQIYKRHGQGTYTFGPNSEWAGDKYVGKYEDGKRHGQGTYTYANGNKEIGEWQNDNLNGHATTYYANGNIKQEGVFKDHEFLYELKKQ